VRSQQTVEDGTPPQAQPAGVPGATTNQPPATGTAPVNGAAAPLGTASNGDKAGTMRKESVINYEIDKTVRTVREASGTVKRLTAAVVVNHRSSLDPKTGKATSAAIPPEQIEQMTALVRETIGFNKDRGDSVNVINAVFNVATPVEEVPVAWWKQPENIELARSLAWPLGGLGVALLILMGMVRPTLKLMKSAPMPVPASAPQLNALVDETPERPGLPAPVEGTETTADQLRLADAKRLALENPIAVANIVKGWVNGEQPA
jgi:flagellar M-ring protein FliF